MKYSIFLLLSLILTACHPSLERRIRDIHTASENLGKEAATLVDGLVQQRNSINIQGRALTPEEITFTGKVDILEARINQWEITLKAVSNSPSNGGRLNKEESLRDEITSLIAEAKILSGEPPGM